MAAEEGGLIVEPGQVMARKKSWREKMDNGREPHVVVLEKPYAGVPAGAKLLISSPREVAGEIRKVRRGRTLSIQNLRERLAKRHGADAACPTSTSIFVRIVAEATLEDVGSGLTMDKATPFWRVIEPDSALAAKLSCGPDLIRHQRTVEAQES